MAISYTNRITSHYSGRVGDIVLRWYGDKSVMSKRPDCSNVIRSEKQKLNSLKFAKAVKYGKHAKVNPALNKFIKNKINKKKTKSKDVYHAAIQYYQTNVVIDKIDVGKYKGLIDNLITVLVWDKYHVESVLMTIYNQEGKVVESGPAAPAEYSEGTEWEYKATVLNINYIGSIIEVQAKDKRGNIVMRSVILDGT